jgi:hypothetical protein
MADFVESMERLLRELIEQRRQIDADIADVERILKRRGGTSPLTEPLPSGRRFESSRGSPRGQARREILELMSDGKVWTPSEIARARGTSGNAASNTLRRLLLEDPPAVIELKRGSGRYKIASPKGDDAQASLSGSERAE